MNKQYTLAELANLLQATVIGDDRCVITGIAPLDTAQPGHISFLHNPKYASQLSKTQASAVIVTRQAANDCKTNAVIVSDPHLAYAKTSHLFAPQRQRQAGIHPTAIIGEDCQIANSVSIGPNCVIGDQVIIGANTQVDAGCVLGDHVTIGNDCHFWSRVSVYDHVSIADRVTCHSGVVIGSDGFGMANEHGKWLKIAQLGSVETGSDVEIGANTTIDRGALKNTIIADGVKLDNQIQIAHNVQIGAHTVIAGCAAIAGSCKIGSHCMIGGQTSINGHIEIADQVAIISASTVANSIKKPGVYGSSLVIQPVNQWRRNVVRFQELDRLVKRVTQLEKAHANHLN